MRKKLYRVQIRVHPAVRRYFTNKFPLVDGAFDLTKSIYYGLVSSMLIRSGVKTPSVVSDSFGSYDTIYIMITEYDFYHYGFEFSALQQVRFSRIILHLIADDACRRVALAKVLFGMPVTKSIEHFLDANLFEENEMSREYLRTIYRRKYAGYEAELSEYYSDLVSDSDSDEDVSFKKSFVKNDHCVLKL